MPNYLVRPAIKGEIQPPKRPPAKCVHCKKGDSQENILFACLDRGRGVEILAHLECLHEGEKE